MQCGCRKVSSKAQNVQRPWGDIELNSFEKPRNHWNWIVESKENGKRYVRNTGRDFATMVNILVIISRTVGGYWMVLNRYVMTRCMFLKNSGCHRKNGLSESNRHEASKIDCFSSRQVIMVAWTRMEIVEIEKGGQIWEMFEIGRDLWKIEYEDKGEGSIQYGPSISRLSNCMRLLMRQEQLEEVQI